MAPRRHQETAVAAQGGGGDFQAVVVAGVELLGPALQESSLGLLKELRFSDSAGAVHGTPPCVVE